MRYEPAPQWCECRQAVRLSGCRQAAMLTDLAFWICEKNWDASMTGSLWQMPLQWNAECSSLFGCSPSWHYREELSIGLEPGRCCIFGNGRFEGQLHMAPTPSSGFLQRQESPLYEVGILLSMQQD